VLTFRVGFCNVGSNAQLKASFTIRVFVSFVVGVGGFNGCHCYLYPCDPAKLTVMLTVARQKLRFNQGGGTGVANELAANLDPCIIRPAAEASQQARNHRE
jgi:hypothetical protein